MNKLNKTKELLAKFSEGSLLPEEKRQLLSILSAGDHNKDLRKAIEDQWSLAENDTEKAPTQRILEQLRQKIDPALISINERNTARVKLFRSFLKYAALIFITAGLSWFGRGFLLRENTDKTQLAESMQEYEVHVPYGSKSKIVLPDGSVITLNSGSSLRYPARFDSVNRYAVIEGEGFFDIKKDPGNPFYVKTSDITIKVLGTRFNVKSYGDEKTVETTLVSGSIEIYKNDAQTIDKNRILILKPNQQAIYEKQTGDVAVTEKLDKTRSGAIRPIHIEKRADLDPFIAWKDNRMIFRDESFTELVTKLERWYDVEIDIQNNNLSQALFSGIFENETVEQALNALKIATPFEYKMNKNKITIY